MAKTKHVATTRGHRMPDNPAQELLLQERCKEIAQTGQAPSDIMEMAMLLDEKGKDLGLIGAIELLTKMGFKFADMEKKKWEE